MNGGEGSDRLEGSAAAGFVSGGAEVGQFVFGPTWGADNIADFEGDLELIDLSGSTGLTFGDLTITDPFGFGDTSIASDRGTTFMAGVAPGNIKESDFICA